MLTYRLPTLSYALIATSSSIYATVSGSQPSLVYVLLAGRPLHYSPSQINTHLADRSWESALILTAVELLSLSVIVVLASGEDLWLPGHVRACI